MKYSKTYAKNKSFYIATFDEVALKTVLTSLLRKWGISHLNYNKNINQIKHSLQLIMKRFILIMIVI